MNDDYKHQKKIESKIPPPVTRIRSPAPIGLRLTGLSAPLQKHFRFMTGRELRFHVIKGGPSGTTVTLRTGGHTLIARAQGVSIKTGADIYLKVERGPNNTYHLHLRSTGVPRAETAVSARLQASYFHFLESTSHTDDPKKKRGTLSDSTVQKLRPLLLLWDLDLDYDTIFYQQWNPKDEAGEENLLGAGDIHHAGASYFLRLQLQPLGALGILITAPTEKFQTVSIFLTPLHEKHTSEIKKSMPHWKQLVQDLGIEVENFRLLPLFGEKKLNILV